MGLKNCQKVQKFARFCKNHNSSNFYIEKLVHYYMWSVDGFAHRNIKLSVYPQLFVITLGSENGTNFKKSEIMGRKPIFEVLYLLNNALKYIYPT